MASTLNERIAKAQAEIAKWSPEKLANMQLQGPCACIGPQDGKPVCPCEMRSVKVINGRYVLTRDLGPVAAMGTDGGKHD